MLLRLVRQPFEASSSLEDFVIEVIERTTRLVAVVAWVKKGGLVPLQDAVNNFRRRGGTSRVIVGISSGGATRQGLELALELFDEVYVFHDAGGRTFHPKGYLLETDSSSEMFIGSNNLTPGGLFFNFELATWITLDLASPDDEGVRNEFLAYLEQLRADSSSCRRLTPDLLRILASERRYRIQDEDIRRGATTDADREGEAEAESESIVDLELSDPIFGRTGIQTRRRRARPTGSRTRAGAPARGRAPARSTGRAAVAARWVKRLSASDAQHPPSARSAVTGNLKLTQAGQPIDQQTYFRSTFFDRAAWQPRTGRRRGEEAEVAFSVVLDSRALGTYTLRVDHDPARVAGQGNVPTWLHWGPDLGEVLAETDYTGCYVILERLSNDQYVLRIEPTLAA